MFKSINVHFHLKKELRYEFEEDFLQEHLDFRRYIDDSWIPDKIARRCLQYLQDEVDEGRSGIDKDSSIGPTSQKIQCVHWCINSCKDIIKLQGAMENKTVIRRKGKGSYCKINDSITLNFVSYIFLSIFVGFHFNTGF